MKHLVVLALIFLLSCAPSSNRRSSGAKKTTQEKSSFSVQQGDENAPRVLRRSDNPKKLKRSSPRVVRPPVLVKKTPQIAPTPEIKDEVRSSKRPSINPISHPIAPPPSLIPPSIQNAPRESNRAKIPQKEKKQLPKRDIDEKPLIVLENTRVNYEENSAFVGPVEKELIVKSNGIKKEDDIVCEMKASLLIEASNQNANDFYRLVISDSSELQGGHAVLGKIYQVKVRSEQTSILSPVNPENEIDVIFSLSENELVIEALTKGLNRGTTYFESIMSFELAQLENFDGKKVFRALGKVASYDFLGEVRAEHATLKIDSDGECRFSNEGMKNLELFTETCEDSSVCTTSVTAP